MDMRIAAIWVVGLTSTLLVPAAVWLLITGRNMPGVLGRGFTRSDNLRLQRAPSIYFRALGTVVAVASVYGLFLVWVLSVLPQPSVTVLVVMAVIASVLTVPMSASIVWVFVLASRYRLFRWDKP